VNSGCIRSRCGIGRRDRLRQWGRALFHGRARARGRNFIGIEVHEPGVGRLLRGIESGGLTNVRVLMHDAVDVLQAQPDASIDMLRIYFPDPWPKKRHHKRG
jgi:tRNA (guanine-N7-)-methyltransferase